MNHEDRFLTAYRGKFTSALRWEQLTRLWENLRQQGDKSWYIYTVGEGPPTSPATAAQVAAFIADIDALLRRDHDEDYCGIVYADDLDDPRFVKIYDPHNLGSVCGPSGAPPPLPGWILSTIAPEDLQEPVSLPDGRRSWWQRVFRSHV